MENLKDVYISIADTDNTMSHVELKSNEPKGIMLSGDKSSVTSKGKFIENNTATKYIKQWTEFKSKLSLFLEKSRIPAKYNNPKSQIHSLREDLLEYELLEFETFSDPKFLEDLIKKLQIKESRFRIFKGIKSIQDIADEFYNGNLDDAKKKDEVVKYLLENRKSYISCVIIMVTKLK